MIVLRFMTRRPEDPERLRVRTRGDVASVSRATRTEGREEGPASVVAEAMDVGREDDARREGGARGDARDGDRARGCDVSGRDGRMEASARSSSSAGADEGNWNTAELHRRLVDLNIHASTSGSSDRESRGMDGGSTSEPSGTSSGTPTGVLPTKHTSKMTTKEVKLGARSFDSLNEYILIKDLGRGSHSKVKLAMNQQDNRLYAVKWTHSKVGCLKAVRKEIAVLKKLNHPNIRTLHEVIDDESKKELILVLEYCQRGSIFTRFNTVPIQERILLRYARDIVLGLDYLHSLHIAHMDLKPENMLLCADGEVKLADFGVSFIHDLVASDGVEKRLVGTPAFVAPDCLDESGYDPFKADIWSLGVCFYSMATARVPFTGKCVHQIVANARSQDVDFPDTQKLSETFEDLLRKMLCVDATNRLTIAEVMQHPWITRDGKEPLARPLTELPHAMVEITEEEIASAIRTDPLAALLQPAFSLVEFSDGEILMHKGAIGEVMYFINEGYCEVLIDAVGVDLDTIDREKESDVLVVREAGEIVGEIAFLKAMQGIREKSLAHGYRTATVRAKGPVKCLAVTVKDMLSALGKDEPSRVRVVRSASFKLEQNEEVRLQLNVNSQKNVGANEIEEKAPFNPSRAVKVLYAEDSMPTQMIVKAFFRKIGHVEVTIAADGKKALGAHANPENNFDLILMDCQMPIMDGFEATQKIRSLAPPKSLIPIIGVSSGIEGISDECLQAGMNDFTPKPLNVQKLVDMMKNNLPELFIDAREE